MREHSANIPEILRAGWEVLRLMNLTSRNVANEAY